MCFPWRSKWPRLTATRNLIHEIAVRRIYIHTRVRYRIVYTYRHAFASACSDNWAQAAPRGDASPNKLDRFPRAPRASIATTTWTVIKLMRRSIGPIARSNRFVASFRKIFDRVIARAARRGGPAEFRMRDTQTRADEDEETREFPYVFYIGKHHYFRISILIVFFICQLRDTISRMERRQISA